MSKRGIRKGGILILNTKKTEVSIDRSYFACNGSCVTQFPYSPLIDLRSTLIFTVYCRRFRIVPVRGGYLMLDQKINRRGYMKLHLHHRHRQ